MCRKAIVLALIYSVVSQFCYCIDLLSHLFQASELFYHIPKGSEANEIINLIKERRMSRVVSLYPVTDTLVLYKMHRYYTELELNRTFVETRTLQNAIKDMLPYLPDGKFNNLQIYFLRQLPICLLTMTSWVKNNALILAHNFSVNL